MKVRIERLPSGVRGLDDVLGGGIPELSLTLIAGGPGAGKTTLAHQIVFANASPARKALYVTILGEPPIKMLRYQQQFSFWDTDKIEDAVHFVHFGNEVLDKGLAPLLERIVAEAESANAAIVVVDSFRALVRRTKAHPDPELDLQGFMQRLALQLASFQATTFLLGEYDARDADADAVFTVADTVIWLNQAVDRNSSVRKLQVSKVRGQAQIPGLHTARITDDGFQIFPRLLKPEQSRAPAAATTRLTTGTAELDEMMGGGIPAGYSVLINGPSGAGKTVLATQFILEGARKGEASVLAVFEKRPCENLDGPGGELDQLVKDGLLEILYLRPLDLSIDETLLALGEAVERIGAKRAVIDSLSGLELALAPTFREDFRESLYRMMGALTAYGVTVVCTVELVDSYTELKFSPQGIAFLTDAIIMQRYVEIDGQLRRALAVVKLRASQHSKDLREYEIGPGGKVIIGRRLADFNGVLTGNPIARAHKAGP